MEPEKTPENPAPPSESPEESHLKQIRTFEGDVADAIKRQKESIYSIQKAGQAKREALGGTTSEEHHGGRALILALLTLVFAGLGGAGAYYAYNTYLERTAPPIVSTPENQFIGASATDIDASTLSRQALIGRASELRGKTREATAIEQLVLRRGEEHTSPLLSTADFFTRLNTHAPQPLVRAFNDLFMLGALGQHAFFMAKLDSFGNAFPGMLEWEARMAEDILPLFADDNVINSVPTATEWKDLTVQNRDTRVLRDTAGNTVLIYAFFDNSLLVITDNESTLRTLIQRLESQKLSR